MNERPLPSLRTELLGNLAFLATAALVLAVASVLVFTSIAETQLAALWLTLLVLADVAIFVLFGGYLVQRLVMRPLDDVVAAAEAIAAGDLARRAPASGSRELARLATSLNRMTSRLLEEQALVVRAEKLVSVGRLAAGVAHEIGNPLGAINGYTHILRRRLRGSEALDELDGIERETARIDRIVRGLLDYARPKKATSARIDVADAVLAVTTMLRDQRALRDVVLNHDLAVELPGIAGDRHDFEQMLVNLLLNAVDALAGTGTVTIAARVATPSSLREGSSPRKTDDATSTPARVRDARLDAWLERQGAAAAILTLTIADSGPGIPAANIERIFDPFFTTKAPGKGTGLGLSIVARVAENLGGIVTVRPSREGGAAFVLLLPVAPVVAPHSSGMPAPRASERTP